MVYTACDRTRITTRTGVDLDAPARPAARKHREFEQTGQWAEVATTEELSRDLGGGRSDVFYSALDMTEKYCFFFSMTEKYCCF